MRTIYKYPIRIDTEQEIELPFGAEIVHIGLDPDGTPCLWAEVESKNTPEATRFFVVGTGHSIPHEARQHAGSFIQGPFVWHIYTE